VPPNYDPSQPWPLVISLHGFSSPPEGQEMLSRWDEVSDHAGFILVYPQGTSFPLRWNSSLPPRGGLPDDVQFLRDVIAELSRLTPIDPTRIYVNGMSNGGTMTNRVACEMADVVAAVGVVAGPAVPLSGGCHPARPVPIIAFYGAADPLVRYDGGTMSTGLMAWLPRSSAASMAYDSAPEWAKGWAERDGCDLEPVPIDTRGGVRGVRYADCQGGAQVVFYTIEGGGHTWPGGGDLPGWLVGKTSHDISASETMWAFFVAHPLPARR
jgi:polyhydroxybutyrate depolymerase